MPQAAEMPPQTWTAADLVARFGAIPLHRIRHNPAPGTASEQDVLTIRQRENRLYELVDGVLVEKTVGTYESCVAALIVHFLWDFVKERRLGIGLGADGMMRLFPGLVRIPDASFISWQRLPRGGLAPQAIVDLSPDPAVEVLSRGNTPEEMRRKLFEYFDAHARLVWYIDALARTAAVYTAPDQCVTLTERDVLEGGDVLPGFRLPLAELFAAAEEPPTESL